jgi:transcriptional regulator with XRE-family HTH domain
MHCHKVTVNKHEMPSALRKATTRRSAGVKMTPAQLRAARGLLGWSRDDLAEASGVFSNTIRNFENGASDPKQSTLLAWRRALSRAGVVFIDGDEHQGPGVRLREPQR